MIFKDPNQSFFVSYALTRDNETKFISNRFGLYDTLLKHKLVMTEGEITEALQTVISHYHEIPGEVILPEVAIINWWVI